MFSTLVFIKKASRERLAVSNETIQVSVVTLLIDTEIETVPMVPHKEVPRLHDSAP